MNNFVFSQDPLLYNTLLTAKQPQQNEMEMRMQLDNALAQYQATQQNQKPQGKDHLAEIDDMVKGLDESVLSTLNTDPEYVKLNEDLQRMIQDEMMKNIKWKINSNPDAIVKMDRLKDIISSAKKVKLDEDRKVMADINEYIKNYSDLTFDEYKQLKYGK